MALRELALDITLGAFRALKAAEQKEGSAKAELAGLANNLANRRSALGQREAALEAAQQAVDIRRELAAQRPDAFRPNLATSFGALASILGSEPADWAAAADSLSDAIRTLEPLLLDRPGAFANLMANLVRDYLGAHKQMGKEPEEDRLREIAVAFAALQSA